ncbi:MAG: Organic solvent tolerance protein OstA [Bacteroidetes bacterium HLUCCA01]|nr:MAG: Organic solvent tolerance protein OstA [Bacteroidetes bacterium HLUCCA01]
MKDIALKTAGAIFLVLAFVCTTNAQTLVDIIRADQQQRVQSPEGPILKLTGNVLLQTADLTIRADSAWHLTDLGEVRGFGNLRIETNREIILADFIRYNVNTEISTLTGNVIIQTETTEIYSAEAVYSFISEIALFNKPVWLRDSSGVMQSDEGVYFSQRDSAVFRGNVQLADSAQYIEADSMFTNRKSGDYRLYGNVYLQDDENQSRLRGDYIEADSTGRRLIEGNAVLRSIEDKGDESSSQDTTWLQARKIRIDSDENGNNTILAEENVTLWEIDFASFSQLSRYSDVDERIELRGNPMVWYQNIELSGEEIDLQLRNDTLQYLTAVGQPFVAQDDSLTERIHQMKSDSLYVGFRDDQIQEIILSENAELLMHATDSNDQPDGAVSVRGTLIHILFEDGQADRMVVTENIDGEALEESTALKERLLPGFTWNPDLRPQRPDTNLAPRLQPVSLTPPFSRPASVHMSEP